MCSLRAGLSSLLEERGWWWWTCRGRMRFWLRFWFSFAGAGLSFLDEPLSGYPLPLGGEGPQSGGTVCNVSLNVRCGSLQILLVIAHVFVKSGNVSRARLVTLVNL